MTRTGIFAAALLGAMASLVGCGAGAPGEPAPMTCEVAATDNVVYQDCKAATADGLACVAGCGRLPQDGGAGTLLSVGCRVQIGTSAPRTGECVAVCSDCP